jgi:hypothetical protein
MWPAPQPNQAGAAELAEAEAHIRYPEVESPVGELADNFPCSNFNAFFQKCRLTDRLILCRGKIRTNMRLNTWF